jgi:hypothetical protein
MDNAFGHGDSSPKGKASIRSTMMSYFPPVFIMRKVYGFIFGNLGTAMLRSTETGARAVFHVATSAALGKTDHGGGLYSDTAGAFTNCSATKKESYKCGRVKMERQPDAAADEDLAADLWDRTRSAIGIAHLRPLANPEPPASSKVGQEGQLEAAMGGEEQARGKQEVDVTAEQEQEQEQEQEEGDEEKEEEEEEEEEEEADW